MQNQLTTYLSAGYPGLAVISSEEARAEAEIASVCTSLKRRLHAWSSSEGLVDTKEGRVTACPDPLDALQLLDGTHVLATIDTAGLTLGEGSIEILDASSGKRIATVRGHSDSIRDIAISPDGSRIASGC